MKADIRVCAVYPIPRARVWAALTSAAALSEWLMPTDFEPVVGRSFTLRTAPKPGFDGVVRCEVLELDAPTRMVWEWNGGKIATTVTFTLTELAPDRTELLVEQLGFHGLGGQLTRLILGRGWKRILSVRLPAHLTLGIKVPCRRRLF